MVASIEQNNLPQLPPFPVALLEEANALYRKLQSTDANLGEQLEWVYELLDSVERFVSTFTPCKKGCSHCCKMDVHITTLEAEHIMVKTGKQHNQGCGITTGHKTNCPFLLNDQCSIYKHRPMMCRVFHIVGDPETCKPGNIQYAYGMEPDFGNPIYKNLVGWLHHYVSQAGGTLRDIRDFFPIRP